MRSATPIRVSWCLFFFIAGTRPVRFGFRKRSLMTWINVKKRISGRSPPSKVREGWVEPKRTAVQKRRWPPTPGAELLHHEKSTRHHGRSAQPHPSRYR